MPFDFEIHSVITYGEPVSLKKMRRPIQQARAKFDGLKSANKTSKGVALSCLNGPILNAYTIMVISRLFKEK
jgi:hypothetical protein